MKTGFITMKNMSTHVGAVCAAALLVGLTSCRKDLCYDHDSHGASVKVDVTATWEQEWERDHGTGWEESWSGQGWDEWMAYNDLRPEVPDGIRAVLYTPSGTRDERNLPAEGGRLAMVEGEHTIQFYNNDTEYIVFNDDPATGTVSVTTRTRTRIGFEEMHAGERTVSQPDVLYSSYVESYVAKPTYEADVLPVELHPLVYTYAIRFEFSHGAQYVALARGALAGMAESVYLHNGKTGTEAATVFFDATVCDWGSSAQVNSFGIPDFHPGETNPSASSTRAARNYSLQLEVRLHNGEYKTFERDITDQIENQPRGGVIVVSGLEITDEEGQSGGSGFDVDVDDWGDRHEIEIPI